MNAQSFAGRAEFQRLIVEIMVSACEKGCRELYIWDANFIEWPLSDATVLAALTAWARPGHRLHLLALQYEDVQRQHPRFVRWRRDYGHCVDSRAVDPEFRLEAAPEALLLAVMPDAMSSLELFDRQLWRGELSQDALRVQQGLEWFDALTQRSGESFAPTTLGL